jgi:hypothetical protein
LIIEKRKWIIDNYAAAAADTGAAAVFFFACPGTRERDVPQRQLGHLIRHRAH